MRNYGWKRDLPDYRDFKLTTPVLAKDLPSMIDMRAQIPFIFNQGELGSCTANALSMSFFIETQKQQAKEIFMPSRLFIYYNERLIEGTIFTDSGAMIRDGIKTMVRFGVCPESEWPYDIKRFKSKPKVKCYLHATKHQVVKYLAVPQTLNSLKGCLAAGYPFVFGFSVYTGFESQEVAKTGIVNLPRPDESLMGGHAVLCVGYDDATQRFTVLNSWGEGWGDKGFFTLP
jgi:C1A family cysteine protease